MLKTRTSKTDSAAENFPDTYWVFSRYEAQNQSKHDQQRLLIEEFASGHLWNEDSGFLIFESSASMREIFDGLAPLKLDGDDLIIIGAFGWDSCLIMGRLKDVSLLDLVDLA
ncbi:hypothetical protein [Parasphingorhabdus halotolerans]|uniref:hypothetical protein n=1 Tax=Parasphingorhabdus halotolerans TaxID=2725558 RepID=UPI001B3A2DD6|nr:hypothetical protein [Parasphingorhabdus halotolerans]